MKVLGIVGSPRSGSKTETVVRAVLDAASAARPGVETELVNLSEYDIAFADGTKSTDWTGDTRKVVSKVDSADAFVFGTPIYREAYTASIKNMLDLIPRGSYDGPTSPLQGRPVGVVGTGAWPEHYLAVDTLYSVFPGFFAAYVVPLGIYAYSEQFAEDGTIADDKILARATDLGQALVALGAAIDVSEPLQNVKPRTAGAPGTTLNLPSR